MWMWSFHAAGKPLIKLVVDTATVPVLKHYDGNCHVYVHAGAGIWDYGAENLRERKSAEARCLQRSRNILKSTRILRRNSCLHWRWI